jgi:pyrroloquinoline quinone biosynthesis protein E
VNRPYTLVAELTYKCPLRCVYCSNPLDYARRTRELDTATWLRALNEAEELGVVQLNLTGGEPLLRQDLEVLVAEARRLELYTNLITSGITLSRERLAALRAAGLDALQLSFQALDRELAARIGGRDGLDAKLAVAGWVRELGVPLTLNFVLHRENIDQLERFVAFAEEIGADRIELANTQYLGWALENRGALLPSAAQLQLARERARAARERLKGKLEVLFVLPDYYTEFPRACMDGWGRRFIVINPEGFVLPCHLAHTIPGLAFENVGEHSLATIWDGSAALERFRGEAWMQEPCRSCERRSIDFGGCRCQAHHLTGDAAATDPACSLAPAHARIAEARASSEQVVSARPLTYRARKRSLALVSD